MQISKTVHWREREAAEWAARHGSLDTFKIDTHEIRDRRAIFRKASQADLLGRLADPAWTVVRFSWFAKEFKSGVRICAVEVMPATLMRSHESKDIERHVFEMPDASNVDKALKKKRSDDLMLKRAPIGATGQ